MRKEGDVRVLFFGDIVGHPGRRAVATVLPRWRAQYLPDLVVANGENAAGGMGITPKVAEELFARGIDVLTLGNHTFKHKEVMPLLENDPRVLRPANYPPGVPGRGYGVFPAGTGALAVVNLLGRVFMDPLDDPFRCAGELLPLLREQTRCILIDIHAEATSEKAALAWMVDGRVSAVVGTHTHVPTADARILPGGTAFITDVGMVGPRHSILGVHPEPVVTHFLTGLPARFTVAEGPAIVSAVLLEISATSGLAESIHYLEVIETSPASEAEQPD